MPALQTQHTTPHIAKNQADAWALEFFDPGMAKSERIALRARFAEYALVAGFVVFLVCYEWLRHFSKAPYAPGWFTAFGFAFCAYAGVRMWLLRGQISALDGGEHTWRALGTGFNEIGLRGWFVFEGGRRPDGTDLPTVLVGPGGVFALSVRTNSRVSSQRDKVTLSAEGHITLGGRRPVGAPISQAQVAAKVVERWIRAQSVALEVQSVLAFPGWDIAINQAQLPPNVIIANEASFASQLNTRPAVLSEGQIITVCELFTPAGK